MGRGLSQVQRRILTTALELRERARPCDVYYPELLSVLADWGPLPSRPPELTDRHVYSRANFSRAAIGAQTYNRIYASFSRALRRLEQRGLAERRTSGLIGTWSGICLTERGAAEARRLFLKPKAGEAAA